MRDLPNRYKVWSKILAKHEKRYEEKKEYNLEALYSNQKQADNELRKGRMSLTEHTDLTERHIKLKRRIEKNNETLD